MLVVLAPVGEVVLHPLRLAHGVQEQQHHKAHGHQERGVQGLQGRALGGPGHQPLAPREGERGDEEEEDGHLPHEQDKDELVEEGHGAGGAAWCCLMLLDAA